MAIELTQEQRAAVENRGGDLLVSAAAGSGKTRVLVERLMSYVERGEDIDHFLVITFTNAAAAELRDRIASAIHARLARSPGDRHLRRNATLVYKAPICTIDAFCLDFLRQWGHLADLDPDFRLCDEAEGEELRRRALEEVLEARYANIQSDPSFAALVDSLAGERDDQTLEEVILDIHHRIQAQPDPVGWLMERKRDFVLPAGPGLEDTPWGRVLLEDSFALVDYWRTALISLRHEIAWDDLLDINYGSTLEDTISGLERLRNALGQGWDEAAECFPVPFPRPGTKRGSHDEALKVRMTAQRDECRKQLKKLGERFSVTETQAAEDLRAVSPAMTALLDVTAEFDAAFVRLKRRRRLIDFADGEHLTARLLAQPDGAPSGLAGDTGRQFREIMVDEYQDTNAVQNAIFRALAAESSLFMVGDVKQSIYRFRLAEPEIFLAKYDSFPLAEEAAVGQGRKLLLSDNFRSRPEVLDAVNFIFRGVMTRAAGELDYSDAEALRPGRADLFPDERYRVELNCVDLSSLTDDEEGEQTGKDQVTARAAARRIRELLDSGLTIGERPVRAEDIVILLRSPGPVLRHYAAALDELGVPWSAEGGQEFFGTTEIAATVALLQVLDNPRQDVPLLAALRSPLFHFTPDRLALLRAEAGEGTVYDCLTAGADRGEEDCVSFLALLSELRELAAEESSHRLLWHIYGRLDVPAVFSAMLDGPRRRANLMALYDEACRFESGGHRGLMAFLLHMSRMAENGLTVPVPGSETGGVRILSIHKSKGLEFPVVLVCGLDRQFNDADAKATILFHPKLGLGPKRTDRERGLRYTTVARDAVALRLRQQLRAEEMRLLYVAMTRAEHKLILFSAVNSRGNGLAALAGQAQYPPPPWQMGSARRMADWVLATALCRTDSTPLWSGLNIPRPVPPASEGFPWDIRLLPGSDYERPQALEIAEIQRPVSPRLPDGLAQRLSWRYPYAACAAIPSKLTATQLKGREKDSEAAENAVELRPATVQSALRHPVFEGQRPLTPAQQGTALHMVMQYLDFDRAGSLAEIEDEISRLVIGQYITPQQGAAVNPADILDFFRSDLGRRLQVSQWVEREFKFSLLVPAADYYDGAGPEEEVLLQGVVDCWFTEADGTVTVVDFKTDRVNGHTVMRRAEDYRLQLDAYTRALSQAAGVTVKRRCLWFFSAGRAVEL